VCNTQNYGYCHSLLAGDLHKLKDIESSVRNCGTNFSETQCIPKYSLKILWCEPVDIPVFSATVHTVSWQLAWMMFLLMQSKNYFSKLEVSFTSCCHLLKFLCLEMCATHRSSFYSKPHCHKIYTFCGFHSCFKFDTKSEAKSLLLYGRHIKMQEKQNHGPMQMIKTLWKSPKLVRTNCCVKVIVITISHSMSIYMCMNGDFPVRTFWTNLIIHYIWLRLWPEILIYSLNKGFHCFQNWQSLKLCVLCIAKFLDILQVVCVPWREKLWTFTSFFITANHAVASKISLQSFYDEAFCIRTIAFITQLTSTSLSQTFLQLNEGNVYHNSNWSILGVCMVNAHNKNGIL
jgi:hypothetical protein